jgi:beta-galactosidase
MDWTRRNLLKTGAVAPVWAAALRDSNAGAESPEEPLATGEPSGPTPASQNRERLLLDFGWRFHLGHANDPVQDFGFGGGRSGNFQKTGNFLDPSSQAFDDSDWNQVDLPHDWAIELPFQNDPALTSKGFCPLGRTYPATSVGWYRRVFELPATDAGKRISIEFHGSYRDTMVVLNGFYIGRHSGGYDPFDFDVTDFATPGGRNVLLVRVDATLSDGWFYEGAGIYRHVWLVKTHPLHVKKWGAFVRAEIRPGEAELSIRTELTNHDQHAAKARVVSTVLDPSGRVAGRVAGPATAIPASEDGAYEQNLVVARPALWSLEERNQYTLVTEVESDGALTDRYETRFGIRALRFDPQKGFFLNDKFVKVKGTCNHQDHAGLGAALPDAVQYYRIRKLQEMGSNAIRTSHNPPTPELLDACDELGMLVLDETRMMSSNPEGLAQFENLVRRDRNHPSVFMWSMGNEEGQANSQTGLKILTSMKSVATRHDGSRPVSIAPIHAIGVGGLALCDVMGYNYMDPGAEDYHKAHPSIPVIGTETVSAVGTRGIYSTDAERGYVGSYDPYTTTGRASAEGWWRFANSREWLAGGFVWTGFDYRGEPSPNGWPNISSQYGIIDTCGFPKDAFYYYQSWWTSMPVLHLFPHWDWPGMDGEEIAVWTYSNMDRVELFLNGRSLGAKDTKKDSHLAWLVKYAPGTIEARGYKDGKHVLRSTRETTSAPAKLMMKADRDRISANGEDVAFVAVEVQDAQGRVAPTAGNEVAFQVTGEGKLIGTGNGDPTNQEPDKGSSRRAFSGYCMAIVQSTKVAGNIAVEASSPGLAPAKVTIVADNVPLRPQVGVWVRQAPVGPGVAGLWRGRPEANMLFTLVQHDNTLTGSVEGGGGRGSEPIEDGRVEGDALFFKAGNVTYLGTFAGDRIQLKRTNNSSRRLGDGSSSSAEPRPAVGPPPDGSDPSRGIGVRSFEPSPITLHRAQR